MDDVRNGKGMSMDDDRRLGMVDLLFEDALLSMVSRLLRNKLPLIFDFDEELGSMSLYVLNILSMSALIPYSLSF
jgi:hypothetical protein